MVNITSPSVKDQPETGKKHASLDSSAQVVERGIHAHSKQLEVGDRMWVNIPQKGFVGIGTVKATTVAASDFRLRDSLTEADYHSEYTDTENSEYFVEIDWIKTVPTTEAYRESGFFGNQNTVCKPVTKNWNHTVKKLKQHFEVE